jgi:hypothetical protein
VKKPDISPLPPDPPLAVLKVPEIVFRAFHFLISVIDASVRCTDKSFLSPNNRRTLNGALVTAVLLGSVADWPLCHCYEGAARSGRCAQKGNRRENLSDHRRDAPVRRSSHNWCRDGRRHCPGGRISLVPGNPPVLGTIIDASGHTQHVAMAYTSH